MHRNIPLSEEHKDKISIANKGKHSHNKGKPEPKEHRDAIALGHGAKLFNVYRQDTNKLVGQFINQSDCGRAIGIDRSNISGCLLVKVDSSGGYIFRFDNLQDDMVRSKVADDRRIKREQIQAEQIKVLEPFRFKKGQASPNKGVPMSDVAKQKMIETKKARVWTLEDENRIAIARGSRPFSVYEEDTDKLVGTWVSNKVCARDLSINRTKVNACLHGHRKSHKGYIFKYVDIKE